MKQSNKDKRLANRLASWGVTMKGSQENKVDTRIRTGGYHKPGSNNK